MDNFEKELATRLSIMFDFVEGTDKFIEKVLDLMEIIDFDDNFDDDTKPLMIQFIRDMVMINQICINNKKGFGAYIYQQTGLDFYK